MVWQVRALTELQALHAATGKDADVLDKNKVYLEQKLALLATRQAAAVAAGEEHMAVMAYDVVV